MILSVARKDSDSDDKTAWHLDPEYVAVDNQGQTIVATKSK